MRHTSSVTAISWIPSEAISGMTRLPFDVGVGHYDDPPPDVIDDLGALRDAGRFRFANHLAAWVEVEDGRITDHGYSGGGEISSTVLRLGRHAASIAAVALPDVQQPPAVSDGAVRFVQTTGGRTGVPLPRRVSRPPFIQVSAPLAWTTLALTIGADGSVRHELVGASVFPRHWVYDETGTLVAKSGLVDYRGWSLKAFGKHTPWGDEDSPALVSQVESALERQLSGDIMRGGVKPRISKLAPGAALITEGDEGSDVFLVLDGVVTVDVGGRELGSLGPGAVVGERALLGGGRRTASVRAVTPCRVAAIAGSELNPDHLADLAASHQRENAPAG